MNTTESKPVVYATSLESAKEGETVLLWYHSTPEAQIITKATHTKLEIHGYGFKFNREGYQKGNRYGGVRIRASSAEEIQAAIQERSDKEEFSRLSYELRERPWRRLTLDQLRQVSALVESFKAADPQS